MTDQALRTAPPAALPRLLAGARDPRVAIVLLITGIFVAAHFGYHVIEGGLATFATALGVCTATEYALSVFLRGRRPSVLSAYISGISLTLLLKTPAGVWPFAVGGFLAIASKYVLTWRGNHLWNPTNFAICTLLLVAPGTVSILSHQFGNDLGVNAVIWALGLAITIRARVFHITIAYVACFLLFAALRAGLNGQAYLTELSPLTGPMYQLFIFFMITDPRTTVRSVRGQFLVVVLIALMETGIRLLGDRGAALGGFGPSLYAGAPLWALFLVGPVAKFVDQERRRRAEAGTP